MTTSGSYNWILDRDHIMLMALIEINALGVQDTTTTLASTNEYINGFLAYKFNAMLKTWSADGIKVPKRKIAYLFPQLNQNSYQLGSISDSDYCTNSYVATTLTTAASLNATTLTVTSTTGMTANDNIGIQLDTGTRQWTTVNTVNSATSVTINTGLTSTAAVNNTIVDYTTNINRPLQVIYGTALDLTSSNLTEVTMEGLSHDQYLKMPVKNTVGRPNNFYYDGVLNGANPFSGTLYLYPQPQYVSTIHRLVYVDMIQDMDNSTDNVDLPTEWEETVVINYACRLAKSYGKFDELRELQPEADKLYQLLKDQSSDNTPLSFKVDNRGR